MQFSGKTVKLYYVDSTRNFYFKQGNQLNRPDGWSSCEPKDATVYNVAVEALNKEYREYAERYNLI